MPVPDSKATGFSGYYTSTTILTSSFYLYRGIVLLFLVVIFALVATEYNFHMVWLAMSTPGFAFCSGYISCNRFKLFVCKL